MDKLPLLLFPKAKIVTPPPGRGGGSKPHCPRKAVQISRLSPKLSVIERSFQSSVNVLSKTITGYEPEFVLVIETAGRIEDFQKAIEKTAGLEWLADWDSEYEPDENFYEVNKNNKRIEKNLQGRLYLSMSNQRGMKELLTLWKNWQNGEPLPIGKTKWRDVFEQVLDIRKWGIQEQVLDTGIIEDWKSELENNPDEQIIIQIELFFRKSQESSINQEKNINTLIKELDGEIVNSLYMKDIRFHALKVRFPCISIKKIIEQIESNTSEFGILHFPGIMFYRPSGQSVATSKTGDEIDENIICPSILASGIPIVAILDGVPLQQHNLLKNRLILDDYDELNETYQPGERKHGTSMASLVVHGELDDPLRITLSKPVYFIPIMEVNTDNRGWGNNVTEYVPDHVFYEDRIERAVRRMFEGSGDTPAQASSVKVINLSFGDPSRQFEFTLSPCARLLDWLSWKYKVLFCISAGNYKNSIDLEINDADFLALSNEQKNKITIRRMAEESSLRRLLSPSESINNITVGAIHTDCSNTVSFPNTMDILPGSNLPSPTTRFGHGFRISVKPEIFISGGRQLYKSPHLRKCTKYDILENSFTSGIKTATDTKENIGEISKTEYSRGTSNATALATHAAALIYEAIEKLREEQPNTISEDKISLVIKALLVHGAIKDTSNIEKMASYMEGMIPARKKREYLSKFLGYGEPNFNRVLTCTAQRATVIGCASIKEKQQHEYRLPLPPSLANQNIWRRLTITLAWFSPIDSQHRYFRKAKLRFSSPKAKSIQSFDMQRCESDHNQVLRGTIQHEVLESEKVSSYQDGAYLVIPIVCTADAAEYLDEEIDYALAVTLEVKEGIDIPIYQEIRTRVQTLIQV